MTCQEYKTFVDDMYTKWSLCPTCLSVYRLAPDFKLGISYIENHLKNKRKEWQILQYKQNIILIESKFSKFKIYVNLLNLDDVWAKDEDRR